MSVTAGDLGAMKLLAKLLAKLLVSIEDPHGQCVGIDVQRPGVGTVFMPSGDRYAVSVEWLGDREGRTAATCRLWVNDSRTVMVRRWASGAVEVATRETAAHTWGPPITLTEESSA